VKIVVLIKVIKANMLKTCKNNAIKLERMMKAILFGVQERITKEINTIFYFMKKFDELVHVVEITRIVIGVT
jgi:hypothetical protein